MVEVKVLNDQFKQNLVQFLETLGEDILSGIVASGDPLSFGYASDDKRNLVWIECRSLGADSYEATVELYDFSKSRLAKGSMPIETLNLQVKAAVGTNEGLDESVRRAVLRMEEKLLLCIRNSKEPITFTIQDDKAQQVEVLLDTSDKDGVVPVIFVD